MQIVNLTKWRSEDIRAVYDAALCASPTPNPVEFVIVSDGYTSGQVDVSRASVAPNVPSILIEFGTYGRRLAKKNAPLSVLASGRMLEEAAFGQLARFIMAAVSTEQTGVIERPARTVPKWARDITFVERELITGKEARQVGRLCRHIERHRVMLHSVYGEGPMAKTYMRLEEIPALLNLATLETQAEVLLARERLTSAIQRARENWIEHRAHAEAKIREFAKRRAILDRRYGSSSGG